MKIRNNLLYRVKSQHSHFYLFYTRMGLLINKLLISDRKYVEKKFLKNFGLKPELEKPQRYNEHISKLLLEYNDPLAASCADKYEVRNFIRRKLSDEILNDLFGVYTNIKEVEKDFQMFPNQFVLKATHGCGWNFICKNKDEVDFKKLKITLRHWLSSNFYYCQRELIYKDIKPRIICEKYLEDESGGLIDYKVHCFNGTPKFINVIVGRSKNMILNTYDVEWEFIDISFSRHYPNNKGIIIKKPEVFKKLLEFSSVLSNDFPYVRVDFYIVKNKIYFSELTFTPGNGSYMFSKDEDLFFGKFFENKLNEN
jgi:hypothetical protein